MSVSLLDESIAAIAIQEWWFFGSQYVEGESSSLPIKKASGRHGTAGDEARLGFRQRVLTYIKAGVYPNSDGWKKYKDDAWSAAFVSFCMRMGGAGKNFPYSVGHHRYVSEAVRNKDAKKFSNAIIAYRSDELAPSVGDLLWRGRKVKNRKGEWVDGTSKWDLDDIISHLKAKRGGFPSHCDLVVDVDQENGLLYTIGGNVGDRVLRMQSKIDDEGHLVDSRYKVILQNNITEFSVS